MEKRYIDLIHELQDCETARNFVLARAEAAESERDALHSEVATYRKTLDEVSEIGTSAVDERDALRDDNIRTAGILGKVMRERDALREQVVECHAENKELRAALDDLFDTHYGMSYHHCGDGDGLSKDDAARIVALVRKIRNE